MSSEMTDITFYANIEKIKSLFEKYKHYNDYMGVYLDESGFIYTTLNKSGIFGNFIRISKKQYVLSKVLDSSKTFESQYL